MAELPVAVLDACVLVNFALCDTLLRLAEPPELFEPKWSDEIIAETTRTLERKLGWPADLTRHFASELQTYFSDAWIRGYEPLLPGITNDLKDRHVLAAAAHEGAHTIVTFNLRHFRPDDLAPWGVVALHPDRFLLELFDTAPELVLAKIAQQAEERNRSLDQLLETLRLTVPTFVNKLSTEL